MMTEEEFDAAVMASGNVDMIGDGTMDYGGPTCGADDCDTPVDDDGDTCDECAPCPTCRGAGGWQQHDGLIVECPYGCMTGGPS